MVNRKSTEKRVQGGVASSDVTHSAWIGGNEFVFPAILDLHVRVGARIADVTFGRGVFWKLVDRSRYVVLASDLSLDDDVPSVFPDLVITSGIDFASLPYDSCSLDAVVLDPPYMEGFYRDDALSRAGQGSHRSFSRAYSSGSETVGNRTSGRLAWQDRVVDAYRVAGREAWRVLSDNGVFIVKCQDAVSANLQRLAHVELITHFEAVGFYCKDLFVVVRPAKPGMSRVKTQVHARKNHSYFLVFTKLQKKSPVVSCSVCRDDQ